MMSARRGRGRGAPLTPSHVVTKTQLHRELEGVGFSPPNDPPKYTELPWNTIEILGSIGIPPSTVVPITLRDIALKVQNVVDLASIPVIRLHKASIWLYPGTDPAGISDSVPNLRCYFYEVADSDNNVRKLDRDVGTNIRPAKLGYMWPHTDQKDVLDANLSNQTLVNVDNLNAAATSVMLWKFRVLWRRQLNPQPFIEPLRAPDCPPKKGQRIISF